MRVDRGPKPLFWSKRGPQNEAETDVLGRYLFGITRWDAVKKAKQQAKAEKRRQKGSK